MHFKWDLQNIKFGYAITFLLFLFDFCVCEITNSRTHFELKKQPKKYFTQFIEKSFSSGVWFKFETIMLNYLTLLYFGCVHRQQKLN